MKTVTLEGVGGCGKRIPAKNVFNINDIKKTDEIELPGYVCTQSMMWNTHTSAYRGFTVTKDCVWGEESGYVFYCCCGCWFCFHSFHIPLTWWWGREVIIIIRGIWTRRWGHTICWGERWRGRGEAMCRAFWWWGEAMNGGERCGGWWQVIISFFVDDHLGWGEVTHAERAMRL